MSEYGMLIDYEYCTGCKTCEVACKQEYHRPAGQVGGVEVKEFIHTLPSGKLLITNIPAFTRACVFCAGRVKQGLATGLCHPLHGQYPAVRQNRGFKRDAAQKTQSHSLDPGIVFCT
jgi:ferredoxin